MMVSGRRFFIFVTVLLVAGLMLAACERPIPGREETVTDTTAEAGGETPQTGPETADSETGGGVPGDTEQAPPPDTEQPTDNTPRVEEPTATPEPTSETGDEQTTGDQGDTGTTEDNAPTDEQPGGEEDTTTEEPTTPPEEPTPEQPQTHTVAAGENLYRIGLKYGVSWVTLAEFNNLADPNKLSVGQVIKIPGPTDTTTIEPTPSPLTETTYTVKPGDNLFRIGLAYGISWVQIAEANGIINPNQIEAGQVLKIPVETPGPAPNFTHEVKPGETLFLISLQYGVPWPTIAEANNIEPPYVIYVGQTLVIPGGQ
ncbi:MAG: LysM peptidoglycan-binding domain-containing protein [Chloroflexi bacterium]|nr:MAG: LysM peptidoglycan-binding domain-containing protein [Chloroflexota bacterium]